MVFRFLVALSVLAYVPVSVAQTPVDLVRVVKSERKLLLLSGGEVVREFRVALGKNPIGHKFQQGDQRTPEGDYVLDRKKSDSAFYKSIRISYPNEFDLALAQARGVHPGGQIMIHGQKNGTGRWAEVIQLRDWTEGCIALHDDEMDELWDRVAEGTRIEILP